jgi:hypothetical protein
MKKLAFDECCTHTPLGRLVLFTYLHNRWRGFDEVTVEKFERRELKI